MHRKAKYVLFENLFFKRISFSHHCKECLEQVEALLGMDVKVQIHIQCRGCCVRWDQGRWESEGGFQAEKEKPPRFASLVETKMWCYPTGLHV